MAGPNPWDNDPVVGQADPAAIGRPVIRKGAPPVSPTEQYHPMTPQERQSLGLPDNVPAVVSGSGKPDVVNLPDKTNYRPMSPEEKTANHLSPEAPWLMGSNGDFKLPDGYKPADATDSGLSKNTAMAATKDLIKSIEKARGYVKDAINVPMLGNTATGGFYNMLKHSPFPNDATALDSTIEGEIHGNIFQQWMNSMKAAAAQEGGSAFGGRILQSEIPFIVNSKGTLEPGKLKTDQFLGNLDQVEQRVINSAALLNNENPDDPAIHDKYRNMFGLAPVGGNAPPAAPPSAGIPPQSGGPTDNGITQSNPPPAIGPSGPAGPTLSGSQKAVADPNLAKIAPQLEQYLAADPKKISNAMILGYMKKNGVNPTNTSIGAALQYRMSPDGAAWRKRGGNYGVDPTYNVPLGGMDKARAELGASPGGALAIHAGNAATAGLVGPLTGTTDTMNTALAATSATNPTAALLGDVGGSALPMMGAEAALHGAGMAPGLLRSALANAGYGAVAGGAQDGAAGAGMGALAGAAGGVAGEKLTSGLGAILKGVTNPSVGYVAKEVPLTLGQAVGQSGIVGKAVKGVEDRLAGLPVVGDAINARRLEGLQKMNSAAFDRALEPIGAKAGGKFGEQAVADAQDQVSAAFTKALQGKTADLDRGFIVDATKAKMGIDKLPDSVRDEVNNQVDHAISNYFDDGGQITGENMQALLRELGGIKRGYQGSPLGHRIGTVVDQFSDSVENLFRRQSPDVMPQYDAAKKAFKRVSTLEGAVLRAKNTNGVFTPGQLGMEDRANTIKFGGKHQAAAGGGEFHDFQRAMQETLPNKVPDSGTAGRLLIPGALIAGGAGAGAASGDTEKGLTLGALIAAAYTKTGQRALTASVLKRGTALRAVGGAVQKSARAIGHGSAGAAVSRSGHD